MNNPIRAEISGIRVGNAVRFTCPECAKVNDIVYNMPKEFFQEKRDANCSRCKKRFTILTPEGAIHKKPRVYAPPISR